MRCNIWMGVFSATVALSVTTMMPTRSSPPDKRERPGAPKTGWCGIGSPIPDASKRIEVKFFYLEV